MKSDLKTLSSDPDGTYSGFIRLYMKYKIKNKKITLKKNKNIL